MSDDCEHRYTPQGNGISICELCERPVFSNEWPESQDDLNMLAFGAFRYALSRKTYVVDMTIRALINNKYNIRDDIKRAMCQEIEESMSLGYFGNAGNMDEWRSLLKEFSS